MNIPDLLITIVRWYIFDLKYSFSDNPQSLTAPPGLGTFRTMVAERVLSRPLRLRPLASALPVLGRRLRRRRWAAFLAAAAAARPTLKGPGLPSAGRSVLP